jgi:hypothetical protein
VLHTLARLLAPARANAKNPHLFSAGIESVRTISSSWRPYSFDFSGKKLVSILRDLFFYATGFWVDFDLHDVNAAHQR